jgi:polysaccharide export outer membrane protein
MIFVIVGMGFLDTSSFLAQQAASKNAEGNDSAAKPCVVVFGAVRSPARVEIRRRVRLAEVLAIAGGITERAGETIQLVYSGSECFQGAAEKRDTKPAVPDSEKFIVLNLADLRRGDEKANPYIEAGDIVIVTEQDPIYVTGSVVTPRALYPKEPVTLMQAIKLAGGERTDAQTSKVVIHRQKKDSAGSISIQVNLETIRKHRAEDPILQPYDIVEVPSLSKPRVGPFMSYPTFDSRPLIPLGYRIIY